MIIKSSAEMLLNSEFLKYCYTAGMSFSTRQMLFFFLQWQNLYTLGTLCNWSVFLNSISCLLKSSGVFTEKYWLCTVAPSTDVQEWYYFYRFSLGGSHALVRRILHIGLGQPSPYNPHVLCELRFVSGRLFPHRYLQHRRVSTHGYKPWSPLHCLGHSPETTPKTTINARLQQNDKQQLPICS